MRIIEIKALGNRAHRNMDANLSVVPDGWAVIPDSMILENFPFGEVAAEEIDGVMTVTSWVAGEFPATEEVEPEPTEIERLRADVDYIAVMTGVEL